MNWSPGVDGVREPGQNLLLMEADDVMQTGEGRPYDFFQ